MIPKSIQFKILAFFAVLYGVYLASEGSGARKADAILEKNGVTVPGMVVGAKTKTSGSARRRSTEYLFDTQFTIQNGEQRQREFVVDSSFFESRVSGSGMMGTITQPNVEVRYLPTDPSHAIIVGGSVNHSSNLWLGILVSIGGLGGLVYLFLYNPFDD